MKAILALIVIYVAAFIIATQSASQNPVQASAPEAGSFRSPKSIDPAKEADLRSLLESVGVKDQVQDVAGYSAAQYSERLRAMVPSVPNDSKRQAFIHAAMDSYQKNFDGQRPMQQIAGIYDKHYTDDEVKGLLQFFASPLGQKFAAETPKIAKEILAVQEAVAANAARDSLQALKAQNPDMLTLAAQDNGRNSQGVVTLRSQTR